jgi:isopenicillin N synthase-like dioxygenase
MNPSQSGKNLPVIDMSSLYDRSDKREHLRVAVQIEDACRSTGFFYIVGHGVSPETLAALDTASRRFFSLPNGEKNQIAMAHGGRAWRGYFPLGGELTSGEPDQKEGLYFGTELAADHPRVKVGIPLHGPNLWPESIPELRGLVLEYMAATVRAAQTLLRGIALSLDLEPDYFIKVYTREPTVLFRVFHYPNTTDSGWGVGEHTDYGLLTLLAQDEQGGLQVESNGEWIDAPPIEDTLVCNLGDMLDRLTGGWYRSNAHRVRNTSGHSRLSFPLFFDPGFEAELVPLPNLARRGAQREAKPRWDEADLHAFRGTYGKYLIGKVSKVFPELATRLPAR